MTPCEIKTLLHIHASNERIPNEHAPAVIDAIIGFERDGLIVPDPCTLNVGGWKATRRGMAYVRALTQLPLPEEAWRMPGSDTVIL